VSNNQTNEEWSSFIEGSKPSPAKENQLDEPGEKGTEIYSVEGEGGSDCQANGMNRPPDKAKMEECEENHHHRSAQSPEEIIRLEAEGIPYLAKHLSISARTPALKYPCVPSEGALPISCVDDEEGSNYQAQSSGEEEG